MASGRRFIEDFHAMKRLSDVRFIFPWTWTVDNFLKGSFGGHLVSQALMAASSTVKPEMIVHSLHCYFLKLGKANEAMEYHVSYKKDGKTLCHRIVTAVQDGKSVSFFQISFHNEAGEWPSVMSYQPPMPLVPHHSQLRTLEENVLKKAIFFNNEVIYNCLAKEIPFQLKLIDGKVAMWIKVMGNIGKF